MKTTKVIIDVDKGKLKVYAQDEEVSFDVFGARKPLRNAKECFRVDILDKVCTEQQERVHASETVKGQRLKHYLGGKIWKRNRGCKNTFS